jgi:hypothetical protein
MLRMSSLLLRWTPGTTKGGFPTVGAVWGWDFKAGEAVTPSHFDDFMSVPSTAVENPEEALSARVTPYLMQFGIAVSHF